MTEFPKVMEQFKRMCGYYSRDKMQKNCPMCASYPNCNIGQCRKIAFEKPARFAATVMRWAAEHPEPVYPTWGEWLKQTPFIECYRDSAGFECRGYNWNTPIPADIAEKLGLDPVSSR